MDTLSDILIQSYPQNISLDDGTTITLRPLLKTDEAALVQYFGSLPPEDRLCLKEDVTDPSVIENWIYDLDYDTILPLAALHDGRIVGGLGTTLLQNLIDIATRLGLEQISLEIPPRLDKAFYLFEKMGFKEVANLKGFVKDLEGTESDLVLMVKYLRE